MIFECVEDYVLDLESGDLHQSPEEFLISLEEQLDNGDITVDEAILLLTDLNTRN